MKSKYVTLILKILVFGYLFYLFNPLFAEKGHWFSWQGTAITLVLAAISFTLELSGFWRRFGEGVQNKLRN